MAINNPYAPNMSNGVYQTPQSYVNINATPNYNYPNSPQNGIYTKFVTSEQEVMNQPNPVTGCSFYMDGENLVLYVKYADGRPMEVYDMKLREAPKAPQYLTVDDFSSILDKKLDELSKKFVLRKENRGNQNG